MPPSSANAVFLESPVRYADAVHMQERLVAARQADKIPDVVLFLEHYPVITLGRRGRNNFLLVSEKELSRRGVDLIHSTRGGDVTYHGPGQLVMYPILKLGTSEADSHGYLSNLEEIAIRTAGDFGVKAFRREGMSGAWTDSGKLAAIGFALKRWVTMHGMSFNVDTDLSGFNLIVGCGLVGEPISSLKNILGAACPAMKDVRSSMVRHFGEVCSRALETCDSDALPASLWKAMVPDTRGGQ